MEAFAVVVLIAVVGLGIAAATSVSSRKPLRDEWGAAATTLGLACDPGEFFTYPEIHGEMYGHSVNVTTFTQDDDPDRHTRYRVIFRSSLGLGLSVRERTVFSGVQRLFRRRELSFGDQEIEEHLVVRALAPNAVVSMLGPVRRHALRDFYASFPGAVIDDTTLKWETDGVDGRERIVENVRGLVKMAEDLEQWVRVPETRPLEALDKSIQDGSEPTSEPKRFPAETELADAGKSEEARSLPIDELIDPGWIPPRLPESGAPMEHTPEHNDVPEGDGIAVRPAPVPDADETSAHLHIAANHAVLEPPPAPEVPTTPLEDHTTPLVAAPPKPAGTETARHDAPVHPRDAAELLFGTRLMGDAMERRFAQHLEGRRVLWPGTLRSVATYPFDHVFGKERGARATFEITETVETYGARRVRAIVRLPETLTKALLPRVGQRLLFEGTLFHCEAFMRTLYLVDGAVPEIAPLTEGTPTARPGRAGPAARSAS